MGQPSRLSLIDLFFWFCQDGSQIPTVLLFDYNYFSTVHFHGLWENFDIVAFGKLDIITVRRVWKYAIGLDSFHFAECCVTQKCLYGLWLESISMTGSLVSILSNN